MNLLSSALSLVALAQTPASEPRQSWWEGPPPARRTAISSRVGLYGIGAGLRHHWHEWVSTELAGFALFGPRTGQSSLTFELRVVPIRRSRVWLHLAAPLVWEYQQKKSYAATNFAPDDRFERSSEVFLGIGPGMEVFIHPLISVSMDLSLGALWTSRAGGFQEFTPGISMGIYVYVR